jgi:hypothetical protein
MLPRNMDGSTNALSWELDCLDALMGARCNASPSDTLYHWIHDGHLKIPEAHHTLNERSQTEGYDLSICGVQFTDESFESNYKTMIQRLCSSLLQQLTSRNSITTGVALTILIRDLHETLYYVPDETILDVFRAMMYESSTISPSLTVRERSFAYRPLPQDGASIRLLVLLPSRPIDGRISCRLVHQSLLDGTEYEALSYVWGNTSDTDNILVDDQEFPINTNLFEALKALRKPDELRILWVDAICIDQANLLERSSQVAIMGRIYRQAATVIAWLGPEPDERKIVFETLNGDRKMSEDFFPALTGVMDNVYFRRAWIVQEMTLAQNVVLQYGTSTCPLTNLEHYLSPDEQMSEHARSDEDQARPDDEIVSAKQGLPNSPTGTPVTFSDILSKRDNGAVQTLLILLIRERMGHLFKRSALLESGARMAKQEVLGYLLVITGRASCLDPKDKVFSMLEIYRIFTGQSELLVDPDYRQSVEEIMIAVAQSIILRIKDLSVLSYIAQTRGKGTSLLPSWVPDWRDGLRFEQLGHQDVPLLPFRAGNVLFEDGGRTLRSYGFGIDKIEHGVDIEFSDKDAWIKSILSCIEHGPRAHDQRICGTEAMWLAILFIVSPERFYSYNTEVASLDETPSLDPLNSANFPPRTLNAATRLAETYWAWLGAEITPSIRLYSRMKRESRNERIFTTENGTYVAAPAKADKGDIIVAFPGTIFLFVLRKVGAYHFFIGVA